MIRIRNTRTGRTVEAKDGKDAALIIKIEQDRRSGYEVTAAAREAFRPLAGQFPAAPPSLRRHCAETRAAS